MTSTERTYFEQQYSHTLDPWRFTTSPYERRKYDLTVASLPNRRYANAFEPGCSIGVLTKLLAPRCEQLLAMEMVECAYAAAKQRLIDQAHVRVQHGTIPDDWPEGHFDLVVLSEIAYYFDRSGLAGLMDRVIDSTGAGAHVVGVHWRGATDYPLSGDTTHHLISQTRKLRRLVHHVENALVLNVWERI